MNKPFIKTVLSKIVTIIVLTTFPAVSLWPCGPWYEDYERYYSLIFSQELINDARYYPFLYDTYSAYYDVDPFKTRNANIEEWQQYLAISNDDAHYLVFEATEKDIQNLLSGQTLNNAQLEFADKAFVSKHKDALRYLLTAKELEPYMAITSSDDGWYYYEERKEDISKLPYDIICLDLQKEWKKSKDKEIKLRYGYQLVRFAHYNRKYEEAINFFNNYVAVLKHKPEMYYYALSQMAGAVRGTGDIIEANKLFFEVFSYSADLKTTAVSSIKLNEDVNYEEFQALAVTTDEKNDADLLLGYMSFSNPLASARKIVNRSPDAIQAKVLTARAITTIEDDLKEYGDISGYSNKRFPIMEGDSKHYLREVMEFVKSQANSEKVEKKNYWNIATAYLCYLDAAYTDALNYLALVDVKEEGYRKQKDILTILIDIGSEPVIDRKTEERIFITYKETFTKRYPDDEVYGFVLQLLSNRYYLQEEYAKSFMLLNPLAALQDNPNLTLLNAIEAFYNKPSKTSLEQYITDEFTISGISDNIEGEVSIPNYIKYMKGIAFLTSNNLSHAKKMFDESGYSKETIPSDVFGYNTIECFTCAYNMETDYLEEFPFIESEMKEKEIVDALIKLGKIAEGKGLRASKANYLIGNFFYNTSVTGYYRNYLRFGYEGQYRQQFFKESEKNDMFKDKMYLKPIPVYYDNPVDIATRYLEKAYNTASGDEYKARIVFALSKCEQEIHYQKIMEATDNEYTARYDEDWVMITNRKYFKELTKYKNTNFFNDVQTNCGYFNYYVNHL